jgi:stage II sporulation protein D
MRVLVAATLAALVVPGVARGATVFLLDGGGWGHGVGMSQWGAEGYARHGYGYRNILAHYYPHTVLEVRRSRQVRVLLKEKQSRVRISSPAPFLVVDARGRKVHLPAATKMVVTGRFVVRRLHLKAPLRFEPGAQPLTVGGNGYRGDIVVKPRAGGLMVVNVLPLDRYLRGVVPWEVPHGWHEAAYDAQAVAARSYALATLEPTADFDLYSDDRSQMYGGIRAETARTNLAIGATAGLVLTYGGRVITAYYSSTSGGRTAAVQDGLPGQPPEPYLVSVPDPYDAISPHDRWPTRKLSPAWLGNKLGLGVVHDVHATYDGSGRMAELQFLAGGGWHAFSGVELRKKLHLRSTYFRLGALSLETPPRRTLLANKVVVRGFVRVLSGVQLERQSADGAWGTVGYVHGRFAVTLHAKGPLKLRLVAEGMATAAVAAR